MKTRWPIILAALLLLTISLPGLSRLDITVNMEDFFLEDDPILKNQQKFRKLFNNNDFVGVLVESEDIFSRESLELINDVGNRLRKEVPLAEEVVSLTNFKRPFMQGINLDFSEGRLKSSDESINRFKTYCNETKSLKGVIFSSDNRQAWVQLKLSPYPPREDWPENTEPLFSVGKAAYDTVKSINPGKARLTATGVPVYAFRKEAEMMGDLTEVLIIGAIVALVLSILIIQSIQGVAGTLLVIILSVISVFGIQGWLGVTIDSAFLAVPILLAMGVSIGYTVHISRFFIINFRQSGNRKSSVIYALKKSAKPVLFTAFTTIAALLSFIFVEIKPIQWVGLTSSFCILAVFIFSILLFPAILSFGKNRIIPSQDSPESGFMEPILIHFSHWVRKYNIAIILIFTAVTIAALWGALQLKVDFNAEKMTGTRLQHMRDQIHIGNSEIATSDTLDLVLTLPAESLTNPDTLKKLETLEKNIQKLPLVKKTSSIAGVVKEFNYFSHGHRNEFNRIPGSEAVLKGLFAFLKRTDSDHLKSWSTDDYSCTRIFIELSDFSSLKIENNIKKLKISLAGYSPLKLIISSADPPIKWRL